MSDKRNIDMKLIRNKAVSEKFDTYPIEVKSKMEYLRNLVIETANETEGITELEETLKWGEPSYIAKKGTTLRLDWKQKNPNQYAMYFQCTSMMIPTIKKVFGNAFKYEGNRAVLFDIHEDLPENKIKQCITWALTYHKNKHLPFLGQ